MATAVKTVEAKADASGRSFTIDRDWSLIGGYREVFVLRLTGPSVGGYGVLNDALGSKCPSMERAMLAGEAFVRTGVLPCFQSEAL